MNNGRKSLSMAVVCLAAAMFVAAPVRGQKSDGAASLDAGLSALLNSSNNLVLVHLVKDSCQVSTLESTSDKCEGLILLSWKGLTERGTISFSIASGAVRLPSNLPSPAFGKPQQPFQAGGRYLLSLRYAKDWQRSQSTQRPWTADEVQAALEFTESGEVQPVLAVRGLLGMLQGMVDQEVLDQLEEMTQRESMDQRYGDQKMENNSCCTLSSQRLEATGIHLPAYLPSVVQQNRYQADLMTHQELAVEWESLPGVSGKGADGTVDAERFTGVRFAPNFTILDRKNQLSGNPSKDESIGWGHQYIFAALSRTGEIRGLAAPGFSNMICPEVPPMPGSKPVERGRCGIFPKVKFTVSLPDDPKIRTILILGVRSDEKGYHFEPFGKMELRDSAVVN